MSYNILIVDDSSVTRRVVRKSLDLIGLPIAEVHEAEDGRAAWEVLSDKPVDVVFLDLQMPVMGGVELVKKMVANESLAHIPVIVISGNPTHPDIDELHSLGIDGFISKPFRPETFREIVQRILPKK